MGHMSFRLKLTLVFIVTVMIEGALIGGFSYYHSRGIVVRNKKQEMSDTINRIDININVKVRYIMEVLDSAADSELVRGACLSGWDQGERSIRRTYLDDYCSSLIKSIGEQMRFPSSTGQRSYTPPVIRRWEIRRMYRMVLLTSITRQWGNGITKRCGPGSCPRFLPGPGRSARW